MKVLITGANGFVGKNLVSTLMYDEEIEIIKYTRQDSLETLYKYCSEVDFIVHLAGVNRTENSDDFYATNESLTETIVKYLKDSNNLIPILLSSSIQSDLDNDYGKSKKAGEQIVLDYSKEHGVPVYVYKLPNLFGKWGKPFYNSVVATWCHLISHDEEIQINDPSIELELVYIDDFISAIISNIKAEKRDIKDYYNVEVSYHKTLGEIADLLHEFKENRVNLNISNMNDEFTSKLYSTYLSYLPTDKFSYPLLMHSDSRGSFTELLKAKSFGQVSVNVAKAYETKGEHWHHSKNEKFIVIKGKASIKFRHIFSEEVIEYIVSDEQFEVVDIPTGYTHNITNLGEEDLVTIMWVNELFDPNDTDTHPEKVVIENE